MQTYLHKGLFRSDTKSISRRPGDSQSLSTLHFLTPPMTGEFDFRPTRRGEEVLSGAPLMWGV